jgi:hypothetical protein
MYDSALHVVIRVPDDVDELFNMYMHTKEVINLNTIISDA